LVVLGLVFWPGLTHFASHAQAPLPSPTPLPNQDRRFDLGIWLRETQPSVGETILAGYLDAASQQLNLNWVAVQLRWDYLEPQAGNLVWGSWDRFFQLAAERNLKVLVTVIGAPEWARNPQADSTALAPPADPAHLSSFLTALLTRYPNQIHALQLWEGINVWSQWGLPLQAEAYLELLAAVTPTIRALDPHLILISAALEPSSGNNPLSAIDDFTYLDNLLAGGLLTWVDCVGMQHKGYNLAPGVAFDALPPPDSSLIFRGPYETPHHSWSFYSTLTTYARKIAAQGSTTPLCVMRFGWASAQDYEAVPIPMRFALDNSLEEQAQWLLEAIELMDYQGWVWLAMLDNLNVAPEEGFSPQSPAAFYSLIRPGYGLALAWDDIAALNFRGR
jgi:hypothetical protein